MQTFYFICIVVGGSTGTSFIRVRTGAAAVVGIASSLHPAREIASGAIPTEVILPQEKDIVQIEQAKMQIRSSKNKFSAPEDP